jgi:uncharacterized protein (DUF342 family)
MNQTNLQMQTTSREYRNTLITKIALFLNYLTTENYQSVVREIRDTGISSEVEILKLMVRKRYIKPQDISRLRKTCLKFVKTQEDTRFGSLCTQFDFLTQSNLNLALEEQKALEVSGSKGFLGDLLVDAGMLSQSQRKLILQKQKLDTKYWETSDFQPATPKDSTNDQAMEIQEMQITICITDYGLKATLLKTDLFDNKLTLADLKHLIEKNRLIYGVTDDDSLKEFLANDVYKKEQFNLAKGLEPEGGTDARIFYLFKQEYLKAGMVSSDGSIDFKNRGKIPFVPAGEILAEKIPPKASKEGVNVFGGVVSAPLPIDIDLKCGKGVGLSENKLQAVALVDGYPKLTQEGELIVNDAFTIEGDVDYRTGHIKFDNSIVITGAVKSGFKVEGIDVVANAVDGGIIKAGGNVCIKNGITDASIRAKGNISAGFIHRSNIACMGDMEVDKEMVETRATLEGKFKMPKGRMYASSLAAKGGATIWDIGSERTQPNIITVGTSPYFEKKLDLLNQRMEKHQALFENKTLEKMKNDTDCAGLTQKINRLEQSGKDLRKSCRISKEPLIDSRELDPKTEPDSINEEISDLHEQKIFLERKGQDLEQEMTIFSDAVKQDIKEKFDLKKRNLTNPPRPILDVSGQIFSGTQIKGRYTGIVMQGDIIKARIMEMPCTEGQGSKKGWQMTTTSL